MVVFCVMQCVTCMHRAWLPQKKMNVVLRCRSLLCQVGPTWQQPNNHCPGHPQLRLPHTQRDSWSWKCTQYICLKPSFCLIEKIDTDKSVRSVWSKLKTINAFYYYCVEYETSTHHKSQKGTEIGFISQDTDERANRHIWTIHRGSPLLNNPKNTRNDWREMGI